MYSSVTSGIGQIKLEGTEKNKSTANTDLFLFVPLLVGVRDGVCGCVMGEVCDWES